MNQDNDNNNPESTTPVQPTQSQSNPSTQKSNKGLIIGVLVGVAVLLLVLIGLVVALLVNKDSDSDMSTSESANTSEPESTDSAQPGETKEIVKRFSTSNDKFEVVFYKPQQKGSNTTIEYGLRNKCDGCEKREYAAAYSLMGLVTSQAYLLDEDAGKKYSVIKDADGKALATETCGGYVEPGEVQDCFISFTKIPSGSTVSFVTNSEKYDGLKIE